MDQDEAFRGFDKTLTLNSVEHAVALCLHNEMTARLRTAGVINSAAVAVPALIAAAPVGDPLHQWECP